MDRLKLIVVTIALGLEEGKGALALSQDDLIIKEIVNRQCYVFPKVNPKAIRHVDTSDGKLDWAYRIKTYYTLIVINKITGKIHKENYESTKIKFKEFYIGFRSKEEVVPGMIKYKRQKWDLAYGDFVCK